VTTLPPPLRVYDTLAGRGAVYDGERLLVDVDYSLRDVAEMLRTAAVHGGTSEAIPGERTIYGMLRALEASVLDESVGSPLALRLEDGRRLEFTVVKVMWRDAFLIQGLDGIR
jgi:hypothetical protein